MYNEERGEMDYFRNELFAGLVQKNGDSRDVVSEAERDLVLARSQ